MRRAFVFFGMLAGGLALGHQQGLLPSPSEWLPRAQSWRVLPEPTRPRAQRPVIPPAQPQPTAQAPAQPQPAQPAQPAQPVASAAAAPPAQTPQPGAKAPSAMTLAAAIASAVVSNDPIAEKEDREDEADAPPVARGPQLVAMHKETWVYAAPNFKSRKLGYLRAGARVGRSEKAAGFAGCENGWYRVEPKGFVCVGSAATLELDNPVAAMASRRPDRKQGLPYLYGMSRFPTPPFYLKLPTPQEQKSVEGDLASHLQRYNSSNAWVPSELDGVPEGLMRGQIVPSLTPQQHGPNALFSGRAVPKSGFAMVSQFEWEGRRWGLTTDFQIVPIDRMRLLRPSDFHGIELKETGLPAAFNQSKAARVYRRDAATGQMSDDGAMTHRQGIALTGVRETIGGLTFLQLRDGRYVRDSALLRLDAPKEWPSFATEGKRWIDVSILKQSLVAYEGTKPVYATLVSTGADGLGDPEKTHSTVRGVFMIHTKHVTVTMDSDEAEDRFDLRDVPYVQYFEKGYALHAAYWHDDFGKPRSHGCVNLHPTDAAWLFGWTGPDVPEGWHGALTLRGGTLVYIHP